MLRALDAGLDGVGGVWLRELWVVLAGLVGRRGGGGLVLLYV